MKNLIICPVITYQKQYLFRLNSKFCSINGCGDVAMPRFLSTGSRSAMKVSLASLFSLSYPPYIIEERRTSYIVS